MIASNTKALTTLLLAKLVAEGKLTWDTPVTTLLPTFRLGDAETTKQVRVRQLICACTGLPRQDLEWLFQYEGVTPASALETLATMQPTSKFGELFQYSNPMAGAAGFTAGHVLYPDMELGAAYDKAMQVEVFDPLGMKSTTFDYARALAGNHADPHAPDVDGKPAPRRDGGQLRHHPAAPGGGGLEQRERHAAVRLDGAGQRKAAGRQAVHPEGAAARAARPAGRDQQGRHVRHGADGRLGVRHPGRAPWRRPDRLPQRHDLAARAERRRRDPDERGPGLDPAQRSSAASCSRCSSTATPRPTRRWRRPRRRFTKSSPPSASCSPFPRTGQQSAALAARYSNPALGEIAVSRAGGKTVFDFGEWKSEVASRKNPDGTVSFLTIAPGITGFEFVVGTGPKKTLVTRDAQHEYVFEVALTPRGLHGPDVGSPRKGGPRCRSTCWRS